MKEQSFFGHLSAQDLEDVQKHDLAPFHVRTYLDGTSSNDELEAEILRIQELPAYKEAVFSGKKIPFHLLGGPNKVQWARIIKNKEWFLIYDAALTTANARYWVDSIRKLELQGAYVDRALTDYARRMRG